MTPDHIKEKALESPKDKICIEVESLQQQEKLEEKYGVHISAKRECATCIFFHFFNSGGIIFTYSDTENPKEYARKNNYSYLHVKDILVTSTISENYNI